MTYSTLLFEIRDSIALVTINRPDKLNALNDTVINELGEVAVRIAQDNAIRAAILTGAGPKAFVAGADISELADCDPARAHVLSEKGSHTFRRFELSNKPVVAAVNGFALGGGCELAMACHFRIASDNARFGQPEVKLGVFPPLAAVVLPRAIAPALARDLLLTGRSLDAGEAQAAGLVSRVFPDATFAAGVEALLAELTALSPGALAAVKRASRIARPIDFAQVEAAERLYLDTLLHAPDAIEGLQAFMEKRSPEWNREGA